MATKQDFFHYVSESLTKPWLQNTNGHLHYYDFRKKIICSNTAGTLLTVTGLNNHKEEEDFFSQYIERPLGIIKTAIIKKMPDLKIINKWDQYRALYLYFLVQTARFVDYKNYSQSIESVQPLLKFFLTYGIENFDPIVNEWSKQVDIALIRVPLTSFLFFPETGYFSVPIEDTGCVTGYSFTLAVPIFTDVVLIMLPKTARKDNISVKLLSEKLQVYSVGLGGKCDKVIIPYDVKKNYDDISLIAHIESLRKDCITDSENVITIQKLIQKMYAIIGIQIKLKTNFPSVD